MSRDSLCSPAASKGRRSLTRSRCAPGGDADFFVAKVDANGNVLWAIAGGGPNYDEGKDVACDAAGNTFLIATISPGSPGQFDGISITPIPTEYETWVVARLSEQPPMRMARSAAGVQLSWPVKATNYVPEAAANLAPGSIWHPVTNTPTIVRRQCTLPVDTTARRSSSACTNREQTESARRPRSSSANQHQISRSTLHENACLVSHPRRRAAGRAGLR